MKPSDQLTVHEMVVIVSVWYASSLQLLGVPPAVQSQVSCSTGVVYHPVEQGCVPAEVVHIGVIESFAQAAEAGASDTPTPTNAATRASRLTLPPASAAVGAA